MSGFVVGKCIVVWIGILHGFATALIDPLNVRVVFDSLSHVRVSGSLRALH